MVDDRCVFSTKRVNVSECACVVGSLDFEPCNYSSVTCISFSFKMAFVLRRAFSTSSRRLYYQTLKPTTANPAPVGGGAVLESPELQQLAQKARGSWKELSKEEIVQRKLKTSRHACTHSCLLSRVLFERLNRGLFYLMPTPIYKQHIHTHTTVYRASFPETYSEIKKGRGDYKTVLPAVTGMVLFATWLAGFLRKTGTVYSFYTRSSSAQSVVLKEHVAFR